ncbi:hypothetical protein LSH36_1414g00012 [Paralvinella palmiformis]|uniref:Uncharacterized protein n=1 Tax=Paralvinella palmiformis TaxID=53620 RepID=A0AAD9ITJ0_9ANNE|nr:hypothetical protein LSH36_1414g00012 [Paralvinella palmiformis]
MKILLIVFTYIGLSQAVGWDEFTELDEYVRSSEDVYGYDVIDIQKVPGVTIHILNMTSLKWFDGTGGVGEGASTSSRQRRFPETDPVASKNENSLVLTEKCHPGKDVMLVAPGIAHEYAYFILCAIPGSDIPRPPYYNQTEVVQNLTEFSINTGAVSCLLRQIPNQPLYFVDEQNGTRPRIEDEILGYSWRLFIEENITDPTVIALFPMVKAAKQGVDTLIEYTTIVNPEIQIKEIMPTGFSKRGWTTWLLGCVDQRVFAMAPTVFDQLNFYEGIQGHFKSLGGWSWAMVPYWSVGIVYYLHHPRTQILASHIDPLEYNERLTMPKHLHGATGDQFFLPDGTHYWFSNITGEMHYTIFENDHHDLGDHKPALWENLENLFVSVKENNDDQTGTIRLTTTSEPDYVKVWYADTTNRTCEPNDNTNGTCRRDFRLDRFDLPTDTLIYHWEDTPIYLGDGVYEATYSFRSDFGYRIMHMEAGFPGPNGRLMRVTSETNILPDVFPYPICVTPEECQGVLK